MKTILITGGAQGIGRGCVEYFLSKGWNVTAVDVYPMKSGKRLEFVQGDTALEETAKHAAPFLRKTNGAVVNVASTRAIQSERDSEAYAASKGGVVALTHALAVSLGPDVRVNCISPGWVETRKDAVHSEADLLQHPAGRVGVPQDIAELADYLISAGFVTGQNFTADGGMTKKMIYAE